MKSFIKTIFSSCLGTLLGGVLLLLLLMVMTIGGLITLWKVTEQKNTGKAPEPHSVLVVDLGFDIPQYMDQDPLNRFNFSSFNVIKMMGLDSLLLCLDHASKDPNIQGIKLILKGFDADWTTTWEIRQALDKFSHAGKWIFCYAEEFTQKQYYLASVANQLLLHPQGQIELTGLSMDAIFFGKLIEKLGVDVQIFKGANNVYKSALEPFSRESFSEENRIQMQEIVAGIWSEVSHQIIVSRNLNRLNLDEMVNQLGPRDATAALSANLIDQMIEEPDVDDWIDEKLSVSLMPDRVDLFNYASYLKVYPSIELNNSDNVIALIHADGPIQNFAGHDRVIYAEELVHWIEEAAEDETIEGIVLRVNSPGGGAFASELINRALNKACQKKPTVVSFGSMAASGGYYLACGANNIYSTPTTLTGSIGVFGVIPAMGGFMERQFNITYDGVKTHPHADAMNGLRPLSDGEQKVIQTKIDDIYKLFKSRVSEGRSIDEQETERIARGRVWHGKDALEQGLVDKMGGLMDALEGLAAILKIEKSKLGLKVWPTERNWNDWIKEVDINSQFSYLNHIWFEDMNQIKKQVETLKQGEVCQMLFPFILKIK